MTTAGESAGAALKRGLCGVCPASCVLDITVVDGRIHRVKPTKAHPYGIVCPRGAYAAEIVNAPDRLKFPLKRVGERGRGCHERVSWDDALAGSAELIKRVADEYGPEAVGIYTGRGGFEQSLKDMFATGGYDTICSNILFPLGSPNTFSCSSICDNAQSLLAPTSVMGTPMGAMFPDLENADRILIWGSNPATDSPPLRLKKILEAQRRGARVIVIDPLRTETADKSDVWNGIRPGTDGALALGIMNVILDRQLYDRTFVDDWTLGFTELHEYVRQFPPQKVEEITWVKADQVVRLAEEISRPRSALLIHTGLEYTNSGVQNIRAVLTLWGITGNLDRAGGLVFRMPQTPVTRQNEITPTDLKPAIGSDRYPLFCALNKSGHAMELPRAILESAPYPVRALIVVGGSILTAFPNPALWSRALESLDGLIVIDRFLTADSAFADFVLPAATAFEITSYKLYTDYLSYREKIIPPQEEARNDYLIMAGLAKALGYGKLYPQTEEEMLQFVFDSSPVSLEELKSHAEGVPLPTAPMRYEKYKTGMLRSDARPGFETPSGKFEISSRLLSDYGYASLPVYEEPTEGPIASPELAGRFPLVLTTGTRIQSTFRSQHLNIPGLLKLQDKPQIWIHPKNAAERGVENGDKVWVETKRGRVSFFAFVTDRIVEGVIEANMGGGGPLQPAEWKQANVNILTDPENRDEISGFPAFKALLCNVEKAI